MACEACQDNARRCTSNNTKIQECIAGQWQGATDCAGMADCIGSYPSASCGECQTGEVQCSGNTPQECMAGTWMDQTACSGAKICRSGVCVDCTASTQQKCDPATGPGAYFACNVTAGTWASMSSTCPDGGPCLGNAPDAYCGDCNYGDTMCGTNEVLTCNMSP